MRFAILLAAAAPLCGPAMAASFDCTKASSPADRAICADPTLSRLDDAVSRAYAEAREGLGGTPDPQDRATALDDARAFNARKARCGADTFCLVAAHAGALANFQVLGSRVTLPDSVAATDMVAAMPALTTALPTREGECARSTITDIGARLEGDSTFSSGTTAVLANGLRQVSYDRVDPIVAARLGDPVLTCLISIPRHCPPGDDRGRFYTTTDLRTHRTWTLPDSQHMCGGA